MLILLLLQSAQRAIIRHVLVPIIRHEKKSVISNTKIHKHVQTYHKNHCLQHCNVFNVDRDFNPRNMEKKRLATTGPKTF